jgi:type II restriction/modification system DNA methylase subunit YeeA
MTPQQFIATWQAATLSERSAYQQHFLDLCDLLGQPKPAHADPDGAFYCFERGASKTDGGEGWADVWLRGHFGWEYKGKRKDLKKAYDQLLQYREALENPPLLVVCDLDRFEVHTNFTGTAKKVHAFDLAGLAEPKNLDILRRVFTDPESLRPGLTSKSVTEQASELFGKLADGMRLRKVDPQEAAHFLMRLMFCMFAEDIDLLPAKVFSRTLVKAKHEPAKLSNSLRQLFEAMAHGGDFALEEILHFNGGLFADSDVIELTADEIRTLVDVAEFDWSVVEPSIFGTLFERTLDPAKRSQIGAHYTGREDIKTLLEPVMMTPLRREWAAVKQKCESLLPKILEEAKKAASAAAGAKKRTEKKESKPRLQFNRAIQDFIERLAHVTVLDPACGSGNFLYVALHLLLDLEKEVITFASVHQLSLLPQVRPTQLSGIEINPYAQQLAQVVIWIGYLQWMRDNGFNPPRDPVLEPIESIRLMDAILDLSDPENPKEPEWPEAEFIVGNPPFLGDKLMRNSLGDDYVSTLRTVYERQIPGQSDLCCYWFEKARDQLERGLAKRSGLLGTQGIRGGANRTALDRIAKSTTIFWAIADRHWILDGASVHVSMVGFGETKHDSFELNGTNVSVINPNLTSSADITVAARLETLGGQAFIGVSQHGPFEISDSIALEMLKSVGNPTGLPNSDVVRPIINASDLTRRSDLRWVVTFPPKMDQDHSCKYERPFEFVRESVKPIRDKNRREAYRERWWIHGEARPAMLKAISNQKTTLITPRVGKHRVFAWINAAVLPSDAVVAFTLESETDFGILHSRCHEVWSLASGTQLREKESGFRYTPTSCFETFPFPKPTAKQSAAIAAAAKELDSLRTNWLNPPEWVRTEVLEFPGSVDGPWARYVSDANSQGIGTVRYPRLVPKDEECAKQLKKRTLTNLYNQRPAWLDLVHKKLDAAVFAAYGWSPEMTDDELLAALLALNLERAKEEAAAK